jgi:hypothetical protein
VTGDGYAAKAASAVMADRYATAAAAAACEATRAAELALGRQRVQNLRSRFIRNARAFERAGGQYEQTIGQNSVPGPVAGIAVAAKYTTAAANAARYAAEAAHTAGARRAAARAERAAQAAISWAQTAEDRSEARHYAPFTTVRTAEAAQRAAVSARRAARAAGPFGCCTTGAVDLAAALLPMAYRERYTEEWKSDLWQLPLRRQRLRFVPSMLAGAVRLAVVLRQPRPRG